MKWAYSATDLKSEIWTKYRELTDEPVIDRTMLVSAVLEDWPITEIERDLWCRREVVLREVDDFFRRIKVPPADGVQPDLPIEIQPGYKRLQKRYAIMRRSELCAVLLGKMTKDELIAKQREHERMAQGHMEHADEIRRYREERFGVDD